MEPVRCTCPFCNTVKTVAVHSKFEIGEPVQFLHETPFSDCGVAFKWHNAYYAGKPVREKTVPVPDEMWEYVNTHFYAITMPLADGGFPAVVEHIRKQPVT